MGKTEEKLKSSIEWIKEKIDALPCPLKHFSIKANVNYTYLIKILQGKQMLSDFTAYKIAKALEIEPKELIFKVLQDKANKEIKHFYNYCSCNTYNKDRIEIPKSEPIYDVLKNNYFQQTQEMKRTADRVLKALFQNK